MRILAPKSIAFAFALMSLAGCSRGRQDEGTNTTAQPSASSEAAATPEPAPTFSGDARALFDRGREAYRQNRDAEAVEAFKEAVRLEPEFAEAHYRLGLAYHATGQKEESEKSFEAAAEAYEKVLKKEPKNSDAHFFLGLVLGRLGKYDDAVKAFKESIKHAPEESEDKYYELALAHYKVAQYKEAIDACKKALEIKPDFFQAEELLEKSKPGLARVEAFRKRQEELLKKQQKARGNSNSNSTTNSNASPGPAPTPVA